MFLLGVVTLDSSLDLIVRTVTVQLLPLAFGAALANELLSGEQDEMPESGFPQNLGVYALGAIFLAAPVAPTAEVVVLAQRNGWLRHGILVVASLVVTYLVLYVLEFRGQSMRRRDRGPSEQLAQAGMAYAVSLLISVALLTAFGSLGNTPAASGIRRTVVLGFPATVGARAARVVLA